MGIRQEIEALKIYTKSTKKLSGRRETVVTPQRRAQKVAREKIIFDNIADLLNDSNHFT